MCTLLWCMFKFRQARNPNKVNICKVKHISQRKGLKLFLCWSAFIAISLKCWIICIPFKKYNSKILSVLYIYSQEYHKETQHRLVVHGVHLFLKHKNHLNSPMKRTWPVVELYWIKLKVAILLFNTMVDTWNPFLQKLDFGTLAKSYWLGKSFMQGIRVILQTFLNY